MNFSELKDRLNSLAQRTFAGQMSENEMFDEMFDLAEQQYRQDQMQYCVWYDNGSGYFEGHPSYWNIPTDKPDDLLRQAGGSSTAWGTAQIVLPAGDDPNQ